MEKMRLAEALREAIVNNSNLEADADDSVLFDNVIAVESDNDSVTVFFKNSVAVFRVTQTRM